MDDAVAVGEARRLEDLARSAPTACSGVEAGVDQLLQRAALEVLHRDVVGAVDVAAVEDGDDVGVLEARGGLGLAAEPLDELAVLGEAVCSIFSATWRCRCASSASQTSAIPPEPIRRSSR